MRYAQRQTIHAAPRKMPIICAYWLHCSRQNRIGSTPSVNQRMRVEQIESGGLEEAGQAVERAFGVEAAPVRIATSRSPFSLAIARQP